MSITDKALYKSVVYAAVFWAT